MARRGRTIALWLVAGLAFVLLAAAVAVQLARSEIRARLAELASSRGLILEVAAIDVPLFGGIGLRGVSIFAPERPQTADTPAPAVGKRLIATLDEVHTGLSLLAAAGGQRRPERVEIRGGRAILRWDDGLADLDLFDRPSPRPADPSASSRPIALTLSDFTIRLEARQSTQLGVVSLDPLSIEGLALSASRGADGALHLEGRARLSTSGITSQAQLAFDSASRVLSLELDTPTELTAQTPRGPMTVVGRSLRYAEGALTMADVGLSLGGRRLAAARVEARFTPVDVAPGAPLPPGWLPGLSHLSSIEAHELRAIDKGEALAATGAATLLPDQAEIARLRVELRHPAEPAAAAADVGSEAAIRWPMPRTIELEGFSGSAADTQRGLALRGTAERIELDLAAGDLLEALARDPLEALTRLDMTRPSFDLQLTRPDSAPTADPGAAPAEAGDDADTGDNGVPARLLGNDDDLPPVARAAPVIAPGQDWLGALLGSASNGDSGTLLDLVPEPLRSRLPSLAARVALLAPKIDEARLIIRDPGGEPMLALESASFSARRTGDGIRLAARAAIFKDGREAARLDLETTLSDDLTIQSLSGRASGRSLANQLARFVRHLSVQEDAELDLTLSYTRPRLEGAPHHVEGEIAVRNFSFEFWRIADREIKDLQAKTAFDASIDRTNHRLLLQLPRIEVGESHFSATLDLTRKPKALPRFVARLEMPEQDCGAAARSIPKGLIPNLSTLELRGKMGFTMALNLDLANPRALTLDVRGDVSRCEVRSLGPGIDPAALRGRYVHRPREPKRGLLEHIRVGPGTPEWVPQERIPPLVLAAAWITEDRKYKEHGGVRWDLVQTALKMDLDHGRFIYGGSTITQQLVKNLYLTRDKNLARKLEELIIAWQMERVLTKDEILTLYVNCIEYGPDIYGIKQAARVYFDKKVEDLDPLETAFIMGLKPYPRAGYNQFLKDQFDYWWVRRVSYVLRLMAKYEPTLLSAEEAEAFAPFQPEFRRPVPDHRPSDSPRAPRSRERR